MTKIEWTEQTWNPIAGCSIVSPGCTNCYAMKTAARLERIDEAERAAGRQGMPHYAGLTKTVNGNAVWTGKLALAPEATLTAPLRRKKPTMYFVNSMSDLFHEDVPDAWIDRVMAVAALCPQHTLQILTKRSARMRAYCACPDTPRRIARRIVDMWLAGTIDAPSMGDRYPVISVGPIDDPDDITLKQWPLPNVWLGVSAERQQEADARIPDLLATPAAVRFVSAEPLLGPIDFSFIGGAKGSDGAFRYNALTGHALPWGGVIGGVGVWATNEDKVRPCAKLDWIIVGGESGANARPMHPEWVRSIRDQCCGHDDRLHLTGLPDVAFFFKQWGEYQSLGSWKKDERHFSSWRGALTDRHVVAHDHAFLRVGKARAGRLLDGIEHNAMPSAQVKTSEAA